MIYKFFYIKIIATTSQYIRNYEIIIRKWCQYKRPNDISELLSF